MSQCCADAQREIAYLLEQCDRAAMELDALRAQLRSNVEYELARPLPLTDAQILQLAEVCMGDGVLPPLRFARALERALGVRPGVLLP